MNLTASKSLLLGRSQRYTTYRTIALARAAGFDLVQRKRDGRFVEILVSNGEALIYARNGQPIMAIPASGFCGEACLIGELVSVSAKQPTERDWQLVIFDCRFIAESPDGSFLNFLDLDTPYRERLKLASQVVSCLSGATMVHSYPVSDAEDLWDDYVFIRENEGIVFRRSDAPYAGDTIGVVNAKCSRDYVVIGMVEGDGADKGRLDAFICGLFLEGKQYEVARLWASGLSKSQRQEYWQKRDSLIGRVVQVRDGKTIRDYRTTYITGSWRWRDDKRPSDCTCVYPHRDESHEPRWGTL
jgi:hypothetical protein